MVSTLTSGDADHVLKWTRLSVPISAVGQRSCVNILRAEDWGRGQYLIFFFLWVEKYSRDTNKVK